MKYLLFLLVCAQGLILQAQTYSLPELKYQYAEYEPNIDALTMQIHHSKHHKAYVDNLNKAIAGTKMETTSLIDLMLYASFRSDAVRNNSGGHYNHTLFWEILAPKDKQTTSINADFETAVKTQFGSLDSLKKLINQAGTTRFGSGWAWLIVTPDKKLMVTSTGNQDNPIMDVAKDRGIPILGIDVWEHAYYLKYQNKRTDYLAGIWNLVDWGIVSEKYKAALTDSLLITIEKDSWPALKDFHKVMSQTFHPAETGDFKPLRARSNEFLAKALLLKNSTPPISLNKPAIQAAMDKLVKESAEIQKAVKKNAKDETLKKLITQAHDTFHVIQGLCKEE
jgi:superoxide dismutase